MTRFLDDINDVILGNEDYAMGNRYKHITSIPTVKNSNAMKQSVTLCLFPCLPWIGL